MGRRIAVKIYHLDNGVRVYGNKSFFMHLRDEIDRIIDCPPGGHCEFQTVSLNSERKGFPGKPDMKVGQLPDHYADVANATEIDPEAYDLVLMIVDDERL